jgi:hypothetical protein
MRQTRQPRQTRPTRQTRQIRHRTPLVNLEGVARAGGQAQQLSPCGGGVKAFGIASGSRGMGMACTKE